MDQTISILSHIGNDIRTRSFFRRDIELLIQPYNGKITLDFDGVKFISRSVADEICNVLQQYTNIDIIGMAGDVKMMFDVVVKGRNTPRVYSDVNAKIIHLNTMEEMNNFFSSF